MNKMVVPVDRVLQLLGEICSECQEKVRQTIARSQTEALPDSLRPGLQQILETVASEYKVTVDAVQARSNSPRIVNIRREVAMRARRAGYSLPQISRALLRHHTTVLNLIQPRKLRGQQ